ncbi:MAG: DEAD/DEAH box helicase [Candidatus Nanopelagicales bacterium]
MTTPTASGPLRSLLPTELGGSPEDLLADYAAWAAATGRPLYPAQEDALLELASGSHVILGTPTGSGKSLVAIGAMVFALAAGRRTYYTAPIKALVSEKFFDLCELLGPERVGMVTGDAAVNPDAPVICATAEILAIKALREGPSADVGVVCMDEFHYYGDRDRGWAWQVPLIELTGAQFLLMSATLGDMRRIRDDLTRRTGRPAAVVAGGERPVPLSFEYAMTPMHETVEALLERDRAPIYIVHPTQAAALERAQALTSLNLCTRTEKDAIAEAIGGFRFTAGFGRTLTRLVRHGIGVHHAGMLPRYRRLVEQLTRAGLLKVVCGTDTLGVGINVPIRTVLVASLVKYDGRRMRVLRAREFQQIAGRAGRPGYDVSGLVVGQAPEHEVENDRALARAGDDPKKRRKVVRKKPPDGTPTWSRATFDRLVTAEPEPLRSRFEVTHAMVLNVAHRPGDAAAALAHLLEDNDEDPEARAALVEHAGAIRDSLVTAGVLQIMDPPDESGRTMRVVDELQVDFALNQPLSTFALAAIQLLDRESDTYALDVLSVIEATLEDPRQILFAQQFRARGEAVAAMKSEGIEYEERMELLEEVTWPRPLAELLEAAYDIYAEGSPWVTEHPLRPKSVVRELSERAMTFVEYVGYHRLASSEGLVLRYLAGAYKALRRTVPEDSRNEALIDLTEWLGELVRQVDSSLLDEWEQLLHPGQMESALDRARAGASGTTGPPPVTSNVRAFRVLVRNALFRRVELAALRRWNDLGELDADAGWDAERWAGAMQGYYAEHTDVSTGPAARGPDLLLIETHPTSWQVRQILDDPAQDHDWGISAEVDLAASDAEGTAVLRVSAVDRF